MNIHFSQRGHRWDSLLFPIDDNRFELTIQFRVRLVRIEPTSHFSDGGSWMNGKGVLHSIEDHKTFNLHAWNDLEWETYKRDFRDVLERQWSGRFVLVPNKAWYGALKNGSLKSALIQCSLSIQVVELAALHPHFTFRCIHPDNSHFRSYASPELAAGIITHEDLTVSWIPRRTKFGTQQHRVEYGQITVVHEFGHVLGFEHVNGTSNDERAYGITLDQRDNLMGMGSRFADKQSRPWETTLKRHLIPENKYDRSVKFAGHVDGLQIIAYWDDDFDMKPTSPTPKNKTPAKGSSSSGVHHSVDKDDVVRGPAGVTWAHMTNVPTVE